jgi:Flp pilus assembly protein TadG
MSQLSKMIRRSVIERRHAATRLVQGFRRGEEGVAAVEFALIVPIMAMMMIGAIELSEAVTVDRRVSSVAGTTGDLIAQVDGTLEPADVGSRVAVGAWMLEPYPAAKPGKKMLSITTTFVRAECVAGGTCTKGDAVASSYAGLQARWECTFDPEANGLDTTPTCSCPNTQYNKLPAPTGPKAGLVLYETSPSVLVTKVDYDYQPRFFDFFMSGNGANSAAQGSSAMPYYKLSETSYNKPRGVLLNLRVAGVVCS